MERTRRLLVLLLAGALLCGCSHGKKGAKSRSKSKDDPDVGDVQKLEAAQRHAHRAPDAFETSDDPPLTADTRFAAGQLLESQGDLNRAAVQYQEALKLNPNHRPSIFQLAAMYTQTKHFNEAIAMWQRYVQVTKN